MEKSKINLNPTDNAASLDTAPWVLSAPTVRFDLTKLKKDTTNPETDEVLFTTRYRIFFVGTSEEKRKARQQIIPPRPDGRQESWSERTGKTKDAGSLGKEEERTDWETQEDQGSYWWSAS